jgi:hypothetical protein
MNSLCQPGNDVYAEDATEESRRPSTSSHNQKEPELKDSFHRRASFQRTALRDLHVHQKKNFGILMEGALEAEKCMTVRPHSREAYKNQGKLNVDSKVSHQVPRRSANTKSLDDIQRNKMKGKIKLERGSHATIIQAVFRGYLCRKGDVFCTRPKPRTLHTRICSEITMSDFNDSFCSLDSLEWSPRTNMRLNDKCCLQNSSSTAETCTGSESLQFDGFHDSFSSIFSNDSFLDLPARPPSRKLSPCQLALPTEDPKADIMEDTTSLCLPNMMKIEAGGDHGNSLNFRPGIRRSEACHAAFSSYFLGDEPGQRPEYSSSTLPVLSLSL